MTKKAIICVDDEVIVLDALKEQLQLEFGKDYTIEVAEDGAEALEIVNELMEEKVELPVVIADFIMPNMKGDVLLERIFQLTPGTKNILLTGQASIQGVGNAVNNANLYRFISKPWDKNDLTLTIKEALKSYEQDKTIIKQNTELKELNTNLEKKVEQRTIELKEANATKDKFFSIIAHDLKNPFNTLMGFSELMLSNWGGYDKEQLNSFISIIFETSKNAYSLLENLLEWSRSQTGNIKISPDFISIYELTKENINLLKGVADKKSLKLENKVDAQATAFADANMIKTIIRNLMSNAIKYTHNGGSITISSNKKNNVVEITVSDTGIGINSKNIDKLFRTDVNYSTKGTNKETGTGLGLILCKEFLEKNHGKISVSSTEGKGSDFIITLPIKPVNNS